jgi:hypothetical protein
MAGLADMSESAGGFINRRRFLRRAATAAAGLAAGVVGIAATAPQAEASRCTIWCRKWDWCALDVGGWNYECYSECDGTYLTDCIPYRGDGFCAAYYPAC